MSGLILLRPGWLALLPVLALAALWLWRRRGGLGGWERAADPELLRAMAGAGQVLPAGPPSRALAALGVAGCVALALAGPALPRRDGLSLINLDAVILVLDASPSATGGAGWRDLIATAGAGVAALGSRPAALIVFAGDAYLATDLSHDHRELAQTLMLVDAATVPDPGTRPERALEMAAQMLRRGQILTADVVLLGDGAALGPAALAAARAIAATGGRLSVIAPPGPAAAALASAGGGRLLAPDDLAGMQALMRDPAHRRLAARDIPLPVTTDLGRWLLLPALGLAGFLLRGRA